MPGLNLKITTLLEEINASWNSRNFEKSALILVELISVIVNFRAVN